MKNKLILLLVLTMTLSCNLNQDCDECFTPPRQFNFAFFDKVTSENLFNNNTFNSDDLKVYDESDNEVDFHLVFYNNNYVLSFDSIGWELEPKIYTIELNSEIAVVFELDMDVNNDDCCTYFEIKTFNIETFEYSESSITGIINVKI